MELSISDWIAIVFGIPTILGLIYTVLSKWYEVRENLKIKKSFGFINYGHKLSDEYYLFLECINHGQKTVILSSCFLKLPDKKTIPAFYRNHLSYNFPYELRSGNNFQYSFVVDDLEATLQKYGYQKNVKLVPVFTTQSGKKFSGKAFDLVPDA